MDRSEKNALGVALAGHVLLFGALSLGWLRTPPPVPAPPPPITVSLVDKVGLEATAPQSVTPPAESKAPDAGAPEDAEAAPPSPPAPEPVTPAPQPRPAPPQPEPKPAPKPAPAPRPAPKPAPAPPPPPNKMAEAKPEKAKLAPPRAAAAPVKTARTDAKGSGAGTDTKKRARGIDLGEVMKGISAAPSKSTSTVPQAATMSAQAQMDIASKIVQQVQPCANRQVKPGPGAERIRVVIHLKLRRDGSLIGNPEVVGYDGTDDENSRYLDRVKDNAIATFKGCAPLRGLPDDLYDVPRGWSDFKMRYRLPG